MEIIKERIDVLLFTGALIIYAILKILFYKYCFIPSPDEYGYVLSSRWFADVINEGGSFATVFSAHGIYQAFVGGIYSLFGLEQLLTANVIGQLFTLGTAYLLYFVIKKIIL